MMKLPYPVVYVTRDIERAIGVKPVDYYYIVSNDTPYGREIQAQYPNNVFLVKNSELIDTFDLLSAPETINLMSKTDARLMVFQNTPRIERLVQEKKWILINPNAELAKRVEEKISQIEWLNELTSFLPQHEIIKLSLIKPELSVFPFVIQFNHSHTGQGTYIIQDEKILKLLQDKFPDRPVRNTKLIEGDTYTVNALTWENHVMIGNISLQITGIKPFTDLPFATIGNDWSVPLLLPKEIRVEIRKIASAIGKKLIIDGWKGLFGIDCIVEKNTNKVYLIEINARQPASTTCETLLSRRYDDIGTNLFEAHVSSLLGVSIDVFKPGMLYDASHPHDEPIVVPGGAQIIVRSSKSFEISKAHECALKLREEGLSVIEYSNSGPNQDILRIRSNTAIMSSPTALWDTGKRIQDIILGHDSEN